MEKLARDIHARHKSSLNLCICNSSTAPPLARMSHSQIAYYCESIPKLQNSNKNIIIINNNNSKKKLNNTYNLHPIELNGNMIESKSRLECLERSGKSQRVAVFYVFSLILCGSNAVLHTVSKKLSVRNIWSNNPVRSLFITGMKASGATAERCKHIRETVS